MSERFFSSRPIVAEHALLDGPEAHHLLHVMRAGVGERITLFDDSGAEFEAVLESAGRAEVRLRIVARHERERELPFSLIVGVTLPKGDRQKWLVEKLTELGVTALVPLITDHGIAQPTDSALDRLRRTVIEAAKQCGRNRLMHIAEPQSWANWISQQPAILDPTPDLRRFLAHPGGALLAELEFALPCPTQLAIGPEGGFTDAEVDAAVAAGWRPVSLGPRILRVETAAIALASRVTLCFRT